METRILIEPRRTGQDRRHSTSRERVLRDVESHGSASVAEIARRTGLHENTIRGHLQRLAVDQYVRREADPGEGRGRPAHRWSPAPRPAGPYVDLAANLVQALGRADTDAHRAARESGKSWGARLAEEASAAQDARSAVVSVMRDEGFEPETPVPGAQRVLLHRCPLREAVDDSGIVCAMHEGMLEGIAQSHDPRARAELHPFAAHGACLLQLNDAS